VEGAPEEGARDERFGDAEPPAQPQGGEARGLGVAPVGGPVWGPPPAQAAAGEGAE